MHDYDGFREGPLPLGRLTGRARGRSARPTDFGTKIHLNAMNE